MILFVGYAIYKQKSMKGKFTDFNFYGEESMQIAKEIIQEKIISAKCGTNRDTENKSMLKASGWGNITKTNTGDYKFYDYYIVAKTEDDIYFIPVKIKGTVKLKLEINPKMDIENYKLNNIKETIITTNPKATLPTIDMDYTINPNLSHLVQFYGNINEFK